MTGKVVWNHGLGRTTMDKTTGQLRWNNGVLEMEMARTECEGSSVVGMEMVWVTVPTINQQTNHP